MPRDKATTTQDANVMTPTASTVVVSSTGRGDSPHASNAEMDPALMVDYNESTPLPSPMDDETVSVYVTGMDRLIPSPMHKSLLHTTIVMLR